MYSGYVHVNWCKICATAEGAILTPASGLGLKRDSGALLSLPTIVLADHRSSNNLRMSGRRCAATAITDRQCVLPRGPHHEYVYGIRFCNPILEPEEAVTHSLQSWSARHVPQTRKGPFGIIQEPRKSA